MLSTTRLQQAPSPCLRGSAVNYLVQKPSLSYSRTALNSFSVGSGVTPQSSETRSFQPVFASTSSTLTPGCVAAKNASPSSSKRRTAFVVITAAGPPRGNPAHLRQPLPSPLPGLVM